MTEALDSREVDLVVIGSGAGGLSAAIVAADLGLDVLVLEKASHFGGSTAVSGGVVWVPANRGMQDEGAGDSADLAMRYLEQVVGPDMRRDLVETYVCTSPDMVDFFNGKTEVSLVPRMYAPDYQSELEGSSPGGRALDPLVFDGRRLGAWFSRLRAPYPQMTIFGGMMVGKADIDHLQQAHRNWASFKHAVAILGRYVRDRFRFARGTRLLAGNALAGRLLKSALDAGVRLESDVTVTGLIREDGQVRGVSVTTASGTVSIRARRGVVLAAGGAGGSARIRGEHVPHADVHRSMAPAESSGDGFGLATGAGGAMVESNINAVFLAPVSVNRLPDGREVQFPHLILDRQKPGLIAVNSRGNRFVNEADSYHDFVEGMYRDTGDGPSIPAWLIADRPFLRRYGLGLVRPWPFSERSFIRSGYLVEAPSIAALAKAIRVPADALEAAVAQANEAARTGIDTQFGRGSTGYNRYLGDATHRPNPCLGPIAKPPFYAVQVWPGDIGSARGIATDSRARVLDTAGEPIAGLYACGNDMNSVMAGTYPAGGITLGPAMTFGYIAARDAAGNRAAGEGPNA